MAAERGLHFVPSFHRDLLLGVMTYWVELFEAMREAGAAPDVAFVPIGQGSGFCAAAAARAFTGVKTQLIGVVSAHATACRVPDADSLAIVLREAADVVTVTDEEVAAAMRLLFRTTHNMAGG